VSSIQAQTYFMESSQNNYVRYLGSNSYIMVSGGANVMTVNSTAVNFPLSLIVSAVNLGNSTVNAYMNTSSLFIGNSSVNCVINSTSLYVNGVDYNPTTALAIAVALS